MSSGGPTPNAHDQAEAAKLKKRLASNSGATATSDFHAGKPVKIVDGAHKYVLISAHEPNAAGSELHYFVTSKRGASYHRNAAEPFVDKFEKHGYIDIDILMLRRADPTDVMPQRRNRDGKQAPLLQFMPYL